MYATSEIDLPAGTIAYRAVGPEDGPPVVFVHGFLVDGRLWDGVAALLPDHRCFLPDWPLGAHRTPQTVPPTPRGVAETIVAFLEALDLRDVTLVGNDTGGAICQFVLDTDTSRIGRVVFTNCDAFDQFPPRMFEPVFRLARRTPTLRAAMAPMGVRALRHGPLGFGLLARNLDPAITKDWLAPLRSDAGIRRDTTAFARGVRRKDLLDVSTRIGSFTGPVDVIWGEGDRFFTMGPRLAELFPNGSYMGVPGARTFLSLDAPAAVAEKIATATPVHAGSRVRAT